MLAKRIIPCLDVKDGVVVKGVRFRGHEVVGDIVPLAKRYAEEGADELVFYDIDILARGADKISVNSPALENPDLISRLAEEFGVQCVVVGIDSWYDSQTNRYWVNQYTGDETKTRVTEWQTLDWVKTVQEKGAGEIVLNMMNQDGVRNGYDIRQLRLVREVCHVPLIASGGAGCKEHFLEAFRDANVDGALAASVFHKRLIAIDELKNWLINEGIEMRKPFKGVGDAD